MKYAKLLRLMLDLWDYVENETLENSERFFALRERVRSFQENRTLSPAECSASRIIRKGWPKGKPRPTRARAL